MAHTAPDATFIIHAQLAIIGVILVVGLFYIWRIVTNIEEKVSRLAALSGGAQCPVKPESREQQQAPAPTSHFHDELQMDEIDATDVLMKTVFGDVFMMSAMGGAGATSGISSGVRVTELMDDEDENAGEGEGEGVDEEEDDEDKDTPSVAADSSKLSKTKLKGLNVQLLKELCSQRGLATDGVKNDLVQRILDNA